MNNKIIVGDAIRNAVARQRLFNKTQLAKEIGISRNQLNNILNVDEMEMKYILAIGKTIGQDFSILFPKLKKYQELVEPNHEFILEEPDALFKKAKVIREEIIRLQTDYITELNSKVITLMEENTRLRQVISDMENQMRSDAAPR